MSALNFRATTSYFHPEISWPLKCTSCAERDHSTQDLYTMTLFPISVNWISSNGVFPVFSFQLKATFCKARLAIIACLLDTASWWIDYLPQVMYGKNYHTCAIISRSWFKTAFDYNPRILGAKIEEFPFLVHKLSVILTALQYKPPWKMG